MNRLQNDRRLARNKPVRTGETPRGLRIVHSMDDAIALVTRMYMADGALCDVECKVISCPHSF